VLGHDFWRFVDLHGKEPTFVSVPADYQKGVSEKNLSLMFPVLLAELRPLFFRYRLRRDKDDGSLVWLSYLRLLLERVVSA
jgi:hypothetical protein